MNSNRFRITRDPDWSNEEYEPDLEEPTALDKLILAGLVSPV